MCGICGIVDADPEAPPRPDAVARMADALAHRGPDGHGVWTGGGVALGHRRLSIIDVAGSPQPMADAEGAVCLTFNGEIYNFAELRESLRRRGVAFRTAGDTEVLLQMYRAHGVDMLPMLRGMFAFAIWDGRGRKLLMARDRLGQKPLVYWHAGHALHFASELKALRTLPDFPTAVDPRALDEYLAYQYVPHPRTIYAAARKLPPGHFATYENGTLTVDRWYTPPYETEEPMTMPEAAERLRAAVTEAVKVRMVSDVPLGAFLSGGVDSSVVCAVMSSLSDRPVRTFSIGFPVAAYDESAYARQMAERLGTDHHAFVVEPDAVDLLPKLAEFHDEPFADSSALPTYLVSRETRRHVTVALSGDAGDELFAGYERYQAVRLAGLFDRLPAPLRRLLTARWWDLLPDRGDQKSRLRKAKKLAASLGKSPIDLYRVFVTIFDAAARRGLYTPEFAASLGEHRAEAFLDGRYAELPGRDFVTRTTYADLTSYLPCDILTKVDVASMACGLECRAPLLDQEVVALAGRMPMALKMRGRVGKAVLKRAFADVLPTEIARRPKMGFGVPLDHWLRHELKDLTGDLLLAPSALSRGWFRREAVAKLIDDHQSRRWDHSARLWALLMLESWARRWLD